MGISDSYLLLPPWAVSCVLSAFVSYPISDPFDRHTLDVLALKHWISDSYLQEHFSALALVSVGCWIANRYHLDSFRVGRSRKDSRAIWILPCIG